MIKYVEYKKQVHYVCYVFAIVFSLDVFHNTQICTMNYSQNKNIYMKGTQLNAILTNFGYM